MGLGGRLWQLHKGYYLILERKRKEERERNKQGMLSIPDFQRAIYNGLNYWNYRDVTE